MFVHDCWNSNEQISTVKTNDYFVLSLCRHDHVMVTCCHHGCLVVGEQHTLAVMVTCKETVLKWLTICNMEKRFPLLF